MKPLALVIAAGIAKNEYEVTVLEKEYTLAQALPIVLLSARLTTERILKDKGTIPVQNMVNAVSSARD